MKAFGKLFSDIDSTTRTNEKVDAMSRYFSTVDPADGAWAVWFLSGNRPKRLIPARKLAVWALEESGTPPWLFDESYHAVGDLAETISLLLPEHASRSDRPLHDWVEKNLLTIGSVSEESQRRIMVDAWRELPTSRSALQDADRALRACSANGVSACSVSRFQRPASGH